MSEALVLGTLAAVLEADKPELSVEVELAVEVVVVPVS